ncbi:MAG: hypothetical protein WC623_21965 [Pedobacter sp.]|uniref:hypothetical protein n=1 Tax=Pedobacter sp. TaxID=1411316 RepID=UPI003564FD0A
MKPEFKDNITEMIQSLRKKDFSYYQIADFIGTTTKTVHDHLQKPDVSRSLSVEEMKLVISEIGEPNGFKAGTQRPKRKNNDNK